MSQAEWFSPATPAIQEAEIDCQLVPDPAGYHNQILSQKRKRVKGSIIFIVTVLKWFGVLE
jgi:hypothetical protein